MYMTVCSTMNELTESTKVQVLIACNPSNSSLPPSMLMVSANILTNLLSPQHILTAFILVFNIFSIFDHLL